MACVDILIRSFPRSGGGRIMIWLVKPGLCKSGLASPDGWTGVKKIGDLPYWPHLDEESD